MQHSVYDVLVTLVFSIILISFYQSTIVQCQDDSSENDIEDDQGPSRNSPFKFSRGEACSEFARLLSGITHCTPSSRSQYTSESGWLNQQEYYVKLNSMIKTLLQGKLLVGSMNRLNQINSVLLSFHDMYGDILQDNYGQSLQYTSTPHDLGHFLEFPHNSFDYAFARLLFRVSSDANFDPNAFFLHFPRPPSSSSNTTSRPSFNRSRSRTINGPSEVYIDFVEQIYNISIPCPSRWFCIWVLDNTSISMTANISIALTFRPDQIGNHTLSFVGIFNGRFIYLASLTIYVKPQLETAILWYVNASDISGLWNTSAGGDGMLSSGGTGSGKYNSLERPEHTLDHDSNTKYNSYGSCWKNMDSPTNDCGLNTGFYVVLRSGPSLLLAFRFRTANDLSERDPITITIEGSNEDRSRLLDGSSWSLIYSDSTGLDEVSERRSFGTKQLILNNTSWFTSYRVLVTAKRDSANAVQYADVEFYGYYY